MIIQYITWEVVRLHVRVVDDEGKRNIQEAADWVHALMEKLFSMALKCYFLHFVESLSCARTLTCLLYSTVKGSKSWSMPT